MAERSEFSLVVVVLSSLFAVSKREAMLLYRRPAVFMAFRCCAKFDVVNQLLFQRTSHLQVNGRPVPGAKRENFELEFKVAEHSERLSCGV